LKNKINPGNNALGYFNPFTIGSFLISLAIAYHSIRNGRSPLWLMALAVASFAGLLATIAVWGAYLVFAAIPDAWNSHAMRQFTGGMARAADPGRGYREKKRQVELVGSMDAKRDLAEESLNRGYYAEAIDLYLSAMQGPLGAADPVLLKGLGRARLLAGDGAGAESLFLQLKDVDPAAIDSDVELDLARALEAQGKDDAAIRQYESVASRYPGEEARCRFALLLEKTGHMDRAQALFREILASVKDAPRYYRSRQSEWIRIAKQHLK
jgi:hypothetical protein